MDKVKAAFAQKMRGGWVKNSRNYDTALCMDLGFTRDSSRYWDCIVDGVKVEVKKVITSSRSTWCNLIVYSEMKLDPSLADSITAVLVYSGDEIIDTMFIHTQRLVDFLVPTKTFAKAVKWLNNLCRNRLNAQYRIKLAELHSLSS